MTIPSAMKHQEALLKERILYAKDGIGNSILLDGYTFWNNCYIFPPFGSHSVDSNNNSYEPIFQKAVKLTVDFF